VIDYTQLPDNLKEQDEPEDVKKMGDRLNRAITELQNTIQRIQAPNMRVSVLLLYLK
jgi:structural maintenance of chromosome 1